MVAVILAVVLIGDGYLRTRRATLHAQKVQSAVSSMTIQELARRVRECEPTDGRGGPARQAPAKAEAAYCEEVMRRIDAQPLQIVTPQQSLTPPAQAAVPRAN